MENRCSLCPHQADDYSFPPVDLTNSPYAQLRCGHQIHTHCLANYTTRRDCIEYVCGECGTSLYTNEQREWFRRGRDDRNDRMSKLWNSNECFREEFKKFAKLQRKANSINASLRKEYNELNKEWLTVTRPSVMYLKDQKKRFKKLYSNLPSRLKYTSIQRILSREKEKILQTYNVTRYELLFLRRIEGAPKVKIDTRRRYRGGYRFFRISI